MSKPVILLDAGQFVGLSGTADGDVLTWDSGTGAWMSAASAAGGVISPAQEYFVAKNGNDTTGDGTLNAPYATVGKAVTVANAVGGDTFLRINVAPGVYTESCEITRRNILVKGAGCQPEEFFTKIVGTVTVNSTTCTEQFTQQIGLSGLFIQSSTTSPAVWFKGAGTVMLVIDDSYLYATNAAANVLLCESTAALASIVTVRNVELKQQSSSASASIAKLSYGIVRFDGVRVYSSGSSNTNYGVEVANSATWQAERVLVDVTSTNAAVFGSGNSGASIKLLITNSAVTNRGNNANSHALNVANGTSPQIAAYLWQTLLSAFNASAKAIEGTANSSVVYYGALTFGPNGSGVINKSIDSDVTLAALTEKLGNLDAPLTAANGGTGLGAPVAGDSGKVLTATASGTYALSTVGSSGTVTSVTAGAGLSGGTITTSGTISMPNVGTAGEYGSASSVAVITTDAQGRVSAATTTAIAVAQSAVTGLVTDLGNKADKSVTATAGIGLTGGGTLGANFSFALETVGTAQTSLGSASKTVTISTDAYGRVTALSEQAIGSLPASAISSGLLGLARGGTGIDASGVTGGQVLVGGTGSFALQSISGDATLASTGAMAVTKLQGNAVSATALGAPDAGKALIWSGSEWQASSIQGGGGGGLTFFMNFAAASPYPLSTVYDENAGWNTGAVEVDNTTAGTALGTFATVMGQPAIEVIPAGLWDVNFYASSDAPVNGVAVRVKVAILSGATQTVIATSEYVYLSDPSVTAAYTASVYVPATDVELTDRFEIIFEGRRFGATPYDVTLFFGDGTVSHVHTTINAPGGTGLVKVVDGFLQSPATLLLNADVDAAAAIAVSKLAAGTDTYVLTTIAGVPTWAAPAATGVTSLTGTPDQVNVSASTGSVTLSLPQSIATTSSPTFAGLTVGSLTGLLRATAGVLSGSATVALGSEVSGTLPVGNGGTGLTSAGASGNLLVSDGSAIASVAMSGDATIASTGAITLKNTGTAATYGSASAVPVFVTDAQGRVTSVTNTNISIGVAAVSGAAPLASPTFTGTVTIPAGASISGFAPLASPTFTGTPSLPTGTTGVTQSAGNNTTALATTAFVTAAVAASSGIPYDLPFEIPGTPDTSKRVVNLKAVRAFNLSATGHQGGQLTNPTAPFICPVLKNGVSIGNITFAAGGFSHSITATAFAVGDVLSVETPSAALGIDTPFATFFMTLA